MKFNNVDYVAPDSLEQVIELLAVSNIDSKIIAGGQSLLPTMAFRLAQPDRLVDLRKIKELAGIEVSDKHVFIGSMTRFRDILSNSELDSALPILKDALSYVAHYQIRNMSTAGGSLAQADPSAELPGIVVACDAKIAVLGKKGAREIESEDFFLGPMTTSLRDDEVITHIIFPRWEPQRKWAFQEFSKRRGDFAMAGVALHFMLDTDNTARDVHLAVIGVAERPERLDAVEQHIEGQVLDEAFIESIGEFTQEVVEAYSDQHASADYRKSLVGVLTKRAIRQAIDR